jgi:hypothetical protein
MQCAAFSITLTTTLHVMPEETTMPVERTAFYTTIPKRSVFDKTEPKKLPYVGKERRMESRRKAGDRRVDIRFDLSKPDRRIYDGRRIEDVRLRFW